MVSNVSWFEYLVFLIVAVLIYYLVVAYMYYRRDFSFLMNGQKNASHNPLSIPSPSGEILKTVTDGGNNIIQKLPQADENLQFIETFMDEVRAYLTEAGRVKISKDNVLMSINMIAGKYPSLSQLETKDNINHFIKDVVPIKCGISLTDNEIQNIWVTS